MVGMSRDGGESGCAQRETAETAVGGICAASVSIVPADRLPACFPAPVGGGSPIVTIITPSLNRAGFLVAAIESVVGQGEESVEHIIVDGGSSDGSLSILEHYPRVRVIHGPDRNSHHALNRGVAAATGEVIGFLMTDDVLAPGALAAVGATFVRHPEVQVVAGRAFLAQGSQIVAEFVHLGGEDGLWDELLFGTPAFCSWFFRRSFLRQIGEFDEGMAVAADRDLLIRIAVGGGRPLLLPWPVYIYGLHPGSATLVPCSNTIARQLNEHCRIAAKYLSQHRAPAAVAERIAVWRSFETLQALRHARRHRAWWTALGYAWRLVRDWRTLARLGAAKRCIARARRGGMAQRGC